MSTCEQVLKAEASYHYRLCAPKKSGGTSHPVFRDNKKRFIGVFLNSRHMCDEKQGDV